MPGQDRWDRNIAYALLGVGVDPDPRSIEKYISAFTLRWGGIDDKALIHALTHGGGDDKLFAVQGLGYELTDEKTALLLPLLDSPILLERWATAICLARGNDQRALPVLCTMLTDGLPRRLDEFLSNGLSIYDEWRQTAPLLLADLGNAAAIPNLREAMLQLVEVISQGGAFVEADAVSLSQLPIDEADLLDQDRMRITAALHPCRRKYIGADGNVSTPTDAVASREVRDERGLLVDVLLKYLDDIIYALGSLGCVGVLSGVHVPDLYLRLWMVHLVVGQLSSNRLELKGAVHAQTLTAILEESGPTLLCQYFGLNRELQSQAIMLYRRTKAHDLAPLWKTQS